MINTCAALVFYVLATGKPSPWPPIDDLTEELAYVMIAIPELQALWKRAGVYPVIRPCGVWV